ncbi:MAG: hypothetical protein COB42_04460 [Sulfurimonas sp.]|nr:MAG: hypothetical protein COB42_04460 [Sulfurimonas sp.]
MIQEAHESYKIKNYTKAFELYSQLAESGNADAQTSLAFMYQTAQACEKNEAKALALYTKAAKEKQPYALFNLAILYANGMGGVTLDKFKAHNLHMQAAKEKVPPAMYEVALMLERGHGCTQNYKEAAFWYEKGANYGHLGSFNNLGALYKEGKGVTQDNARTYVCFSHAAQGGLAEGLYNLGMLYDQGIGCAKNQEEALDLCRKAAYKGHSKAKKIISNLQQSGKIVF